MNAAPEHETDDETPSALDPLARLFAIDLRSLALFRILVALILLVDLAVRATDLEAHYSDAGGVTRGGPSPRFPAIHMASGSTAFQAALFAIAAVAAVALALGWRARIAAALSWYLLASLHTRNPFVLDAGDALLRMSLFWSMFLPLGARFSLDARRNPIARDCDEAICSSASAAILLQLALVYWIGVALKSHPVWWEGDAAYYAFQIDTYTTPLARALLPHPALLRLLTWATLAIELLGPALALWPSRGGMPRLAAFALFCAIHAAFGIFLRISLFPMVCVAAWTLYLPAEFWQSKIFANFPRLRPPTDQASLETDHEAGLVSLADGVLNHFAAPLFAVVVLYNIHTALPRRPKTLLVEEVDKLANTLRLDQHWAMFAPAPSAIDTWIVAPATLADGSRVDLFRAGRPLEIPKPADLGAQIGNNRRRKLLENMIPRQRLHILERIMNHEVARWNRTHPPSQKVARVEVDVLSERTLPPGSSGAPRVRRFKALRARIF